MIIITVGNNLYKLFIICIEYYFNTKKYKFIGIFFKIYFYFHLCKKLSRSDLSLFNTHKYYYTNK